MSKHKTEFHFAGIKIFYHLPNQADVYFLTNNHEYNKDINQMMIDLGYTRHRLRPKDEFLELKLMFEYERHGIYLRDDELRQAEQERYKNIRNAPFILND